MKKLLNFLFVNRQETENKWWHRLFMVFLFGSGILISISSIFLFYNNNHNWITYNPAVFSFELNYDKAQGEEVHCSQNLFSCGSTNLSKEDEDRYWASHQISVTNLQKQYGMDKYDVNSCPHDSSQNLFFIVADRISKKTIPTRVFPTQLVNCVNKVMSDMESDKAYSEYQTSLKNLDVNTSFKITKNINYSTIISNIASWIFTPIITILIWILFWSSIIYRSLLYIIFGKKK